MDSSNQTPADQTQPSGPLFDINFPKAFGELNTFAKFKEQPGDFFVQEVLETEYAGTGEHVYLFIEKVGQNTHWVQKELAKFCGVNSSDIGVAGLKDRNAITQQWFSIYLPKNQDKNWSEFNSEFWTVKDVRTHTQKLRKGSHTKNYFRILLREPSFVNSTNDASSSNLTSLQEILDSKLQKVQSAGVPNYYGAQRFGHDANNLSLAKDWFEAGKKIKNRTLKGLVLSAARSYLFNTVLAKRVLEGNWNKLVDGDIADPTNTQFPTGPLWGRGRLATDSLAKTLEQQALETFSVWIDALEHQGLSQERRPLVCLPEEMTWSWQEQNLEICFSLKPGEFATSVLGELLRVVEPEHRDY